MRSNKKNYAITGRIEMEIPPENPKKLEYPSYDLRVFVPSGDSHQVKYIFDESEISKPENYPDLALNTYDYYISFGGKNCVIRRITKYNSEYICFNDTDNSFFRYCDAKSKVFGEHIWAEYIDGIDSDVSDMRRILEYCKEHCVVKREKQLKKVI